MTNQLIGTRIIIRDDEELCDDLDKRGFGERRAKELLLAPEEALYLKDKRKAFKIIDYRKKAVSFDSLVRRFSRADKNFAMKYLVYRDMKDRGFCVKTGFKFGSHFRVYSRGDKPGQGHAMWLLHVVPEEYICEFPVLSRAVRLAQNVRKKMIYSVVDREGDITYYKIDRITP